MCCLCYYLLKSEFSSYVVSVCLTTLGVFLIALKLNSYQLFESCWSFYAIFDFFSR